MTERNPRYCLQCDDGTVLEHDTKDVTIEKNGMQVVVPTVEGWHCPKCSEIEFEGDSGTRYSQALEEINRAVREKQGQEIRKYRKRLGISQKEAGLLFGGGASAFSEYEAGKTQPHRSTLLLLKLLYKYPDLFDEVQAFDQ